jgi:hypothetical protein
VAEPNFDEYLNEGRGLVSYSFRRDAEKEFGKDNLAAVEKKSDLEYDKGGARSRVLRCKSAILE